MAGPKFSILSQISIAHLVSHIHMMALPALMPFMVVQTELSFIQIGLAISVFNIVSALIQAPMGFFVDHIGAKRVLIGALIFGGCSFFSIGLIDHYYWLIIAMGLAGVANSVYHPADYAILSQNIVENRMGRAFSIHTFCGFLGTAITPVLLLAIAAFSGIASAFIVTGLIGIVSALVLIPPAKEQAVARQVEAKPVAKKLNVRKRDLLTPSILLMLMLFLLTSLSGGAIQNFSVSAFITGYGLPLTEANIALTTFLFANAAGVLIGGQLADYTQRHGMIAAMALIFTAILAMFIVYYDFSSMTLLIIMGLMGCGSGIIAPSRDMLVRAAAPVGAEGRVFGIVSTGFNIGGTMGPLLFAWILDQGHPRGIFLCAALFMVMTSAIAIYQ